MNLYKVKNRYILRNNRPELQKEFKTKDVTFILGWQWNKFGFGYANNAIRVGWLQFRFVPIKFPNNAYWINNRIRFGNNRKEMRAKYKTRDIKFLFGLQMHKFNKNAS